MENKKEEKKIEPVEKRTKKLKENKINICKVCYTAILLTIGIIIGLNLNKLDNLKKEPIKEEQTNKYKVTVYKDGIDNLCKKSPSCSKVAFEINTETEDAKVQDTFDKYVLYTDNGIKIYDVNSKEIKKLNLKDEYDSYRLVSIHDKMNSSYEIIGITYLNGKEELNINGYPEFFVEKAGFYNISTNQKLYEGKYTEFKGFNEKYITGSTYTSENSGLDEVHLLKNSSEEEIMKIEGTYPNLIPAEYNKKTYILEGYGDTGEGSYNIYTESIQKIAEHVYGNMLGVDNKGNLHFAEKNIIYEHDYTGELISKSTPYERIDMLIGHNGNIYIIYAKNGKIMLSVNSKEIEITDDTNYVIHPDSGYYTEEYIKYKKGTFEEDKFDKEGIYIYAYAKNNDEICLYYVNPVTFEITLK